MAVAVVVAAAVVSDSRMNPGTHPRTEGLPPRVEGDNDGPHHHHKRQEPQHRQHDLQKVPIPFEAQKINVLPLTTRQHEMKYDCSCVFPRAVYGVLQCLEETRLCRNMRVIESVSHATDPSGKAEDKPAAKLHLFSVTSGMQTISIVGISVLHPNPTLLTSCYSNRAKS